jgi:putative intracellular protease/amidase
MQAAIAGAILMVLTSAGEMPDGKPTGVWLEEFSVPHQIFTDAGYVITIASPMGGAVPVDPRSITESTMPENGQQALAMLADSAPLADIDLDGYDAVFFPGGHGTMYDFPTDQRVADTVYAFLTSDRPTALVCHGPAALVGVTDQAGNPSVAGRSMTGFTDSEEHAVQLQDAVPFLLETRLREQGATFKGAPDFQPHVVVDDNLITGQNPASSKEAAQAVLRALRDNS